MNRIAMCTSALALALIVVSASPATATPIGRFSFDLDEVFGPFFSVENTSDSPLSRVPPGAPFRDVVIHLFSGGLGGTEMQAIPLNPFDPTDTDVFVGQSRDSLFSDLTAILFDAATLSFGFDVPGVVRVEPLLGLADVLSQHCDAGACTALTASLSSPIEFTPASSEVTPTPEPATLVLVGTGLVFAWRRRSAGSRAI